MNARRSFSAGLVAICFGLSALALPVWAQDVTQPQVDNAPHQFAGMVNANSVYVRSGPGENFYPTMRLDRDDPVTVVGIRFDWLKILPPEGSFCYVAKAYVEKRGDGSVGRITRPNLNVRAGSGLNAMKTTVQMQLPQDADVRVIGERDEYFMIEPPEGAYLYVHKQFVDPVRALTPPADGEAAVDSRRRSGGADDRIRRDDPADKPAIAEVPDEELPVATAAPEVTAAEERFNQLEADFTAASDLPVDQQPIQDLLEGYQDLVESKHLAESLRRVADLRIAALEFRAEAQANLLEVQSIQREAEERRLAMQAEREELAERLEQGRMTAYTAVGTLRTSSLQVGPGTLYRLTDPGTGRTLVYIRAEGDDFSNSLGEFIGVRGEVAHDRQFNIRVISPTEADPVDPAQVHERVIAQIAPPSLLPRGGEVVFDPEATDRGAVERQGTASTHE